MNLPVKTPNPLLGYTLLAAGHGLKELMRFAGFSRSQAIQFSHDSETRREVSRLVDQRISRLGAKSLTKLEQILDDPDVDTRSAVAAARAGMEAAHLLNRKPEPPTRQLAELSVAELNELIESTRRQLEAATRMQSVN